MSEPQTFFNSGIVLLLSFAHPDFPDHHDDLIDVQPLFFLLLLQNLMESVFRALFETFSPSQEIPHQEKIAVIDFAAATEIRGARAAVSSLTTVFYSIIAGHGERLL